MGFPIPKYDDLRFGRPAYRFLKDKWEARRPDIVHIATEGPLGLTALWAARKLSIPVMSTFHTNFHSYGDHYGYGWFKAQVTAYGKYFHNRCGATLAPSEDARQTLASVGIENTGVLSRGVDTERYTPEKRSQALREAWGASADTPVVAYVGRLAAEKNLPLSVEAWRAFCRGCPGAKLLFVGDGPLRAQLENQVPQAHFAGVRHGEDLAAHYASSDLFFFGSETETFGNVVTEAMASALAVLCYDYAAARSHICSGVEGFSVPLGNRQAFLEIAEALGHDPQRWQEARHKARQKAMTLSWASIVANFEAQLRAVIEVPYQR
jgi:glycosyltransferase involved in cell wall biosynthesis